jgi:hypothetical protein
VDTATDPYALSNDTARCWKATGWAHRRRMTPGECALMGSGLWLMAASLFGNHLAVTQATHAAAKAIHAVIAEKIAEKAVTMTSTPTSKLPKYIQDAMTPARRRPRQARIRGRRIKVERKKR